MTLSNIGKMTVCYSCALQGNIVNYEQIAPTLTRIHLKKILVLKCIKEKLNTILKH